MSLILVVDDEKSLRTLYKRDLEGDGHEVIATGRASEALNLIESAQPDLVVLDIRLPEMDGLDLMAKVLDRHRGLPIILNTAYSSYKDNFMSWSADAYVVKSSDTSELRTRVRELLQRQAVEACSSG